MRQLSIQKPSGHRYVIRWQPGQEVEAMDVLATMAADEKTDFDWIDAACLAYQMGRHGTATGDCSPIQAAPGL